MKRKKRLLLVEDNPISQKVEKKLLSDSGYEVEAVSSSAAMDAGDMLPPEDDIPF